MGICLSSLNAFPLNSGRTNSTHTRHHEHPRHALSRKYVKVLLTGSDYKTISLTLLRPASQFRLKSSSIRCRAARCPYITHWPFPKYRTPRMPHAQKWVWGNKADFWRRITWNRFERKSTESRVGYSAKIILSASGRLRRCKTDFFLNR